MREGQPRGVDGSGDAPRTRVGCPDVLERLYDYLDGELTPDWEGRVARHVDRCAGCSARLRFERSFLAAVRRDTLPGGRAGLTR